MRVTLLDGHGVSGDSTYEAGTDVSWGRDMAQRMIAASGVIMRGPPHRVQFEDDAGNVREELIVADRYLFGWDFGALKEKTASAQVYTDAG